MPQNGLTETEIQRRLQLVRNRLRDTECKPARLVAYEAFLREGKIDKASRILYKWPICNARRPNGLRCLASPWHRGRCRWHGGGPTPRGARTPEGIERIRQGQLRRWEKYRYEKFQDIIFGD